MSAEPFPLHGDFKLLLSLIDTRTTTNKHFAQGNVKFMQKECIRQPWHYCSGKAPDMKVKEET
jgi:hypothetical protein